MVCGVREIVTVAIIVESTLVGGESAACYAAYPPSASVFLSPVAIRLDL
jgi:hypothetical protein